MAFTLTQAKAFFDKRQSRSQARIGAFASELRSQLRGKMARIGTDTCLYVTGSGARREMSKYSDLDLFMLRNSDRPSQLDQMVVGGAVVAALAKTGFPAPSKDGAFLALHRVNDVWRFFGTREDDARNLFTAGMLLLLESRCLVGKETYDCVIDDVLRRVYWRNIEDHRGDYLPIILVNDIMRYWRIVLLNYEAKQNRVDAIATSVTRNAQAERRLRSHKLRFSRCLLCYSAVAFLLAETIRSRGNVRIERAKRMVQMTPMERVAWVSKVSDGRVADLGYELLCQYADFLDRMNQSEPDLVRMFGRATFRRECSKHGERFGDTMFRFIEALGSGNPLYRYVVV